MDQVAGLLEFNRNIEGRRYVYALEFNALLVCATGGYFLDPERETGRIRLAVKKIEIV